MGGHIYGYIGQVPYVEGTIMFLIVIFSIVILEMIIQKLEHYAEKYNWDKLFEKLKLITSYIRFVYHSTQQMALQQ